MILNLEYDLGNRLSHLDFKKIVAYKLLSIHCKKTKKTKNSKNAKMIQIYL